MAIEVVRYSRFNSQLFNGPPVLLGTDSGTGSEQTQDRSFTGEDSGSLTLERAEMYRDDSAALVESTTLTTEKPAGIFSQTFGARRWFNNSSTVSSAAADPATIGEIVADFGFDASDIGAFSDERAGRFAVDDATGADTATAPAQEKPTGIFSQTFGARRWFNNSSTISSAQPDSASLGEANGERGFDAADAISQAEQPPNVELSVRSDGAVASDTSSVGQVPFTWKFSAKFGTRPFNDDVETSERDQYSMMI